MLTWAVAWTIVQAGVPWGALIAGIIGDVLIALFVVAALANVKRKPQQPHTLDLSGCVGEFRTGHN